MNNPLIISLKDVDNPEEIKELVNHKFSKLLQSGHKIIKCHVLVEKLSKHHQKGNAYRVEVDLKQAHFPDIFITEDAKEGEISFETVIRDVFKKTHESVRKQILKRKEKIPRPEKS